MEKTALTQRISERLKALREERQLSLDQLSRLTGVSKPMLGQIERAQSNPTVSTLWRIAEGLGVSFTSFIEEEKNDIHVVKKSDIQPLKESEGLYEVWPVFPMSQGRPIEVYTITLLPGCHYPSKGHPKGVMEYLWCTKGSCRLSTAQGLYNIHESEGVSFRADETHIYENNTSEIAELVMVIYYP